MVTKDNLIFALAGMVLGLIGGVILATSQHPRNIGSSQFAVPQQQQPPSNQVPAQGAQQQQQGGSNTLPEGHPPVDEGALRSQIAQQQQVLQKDPENQQATLGLANLHFDLKEYPDAAKYYERALQREPNNVNIITDLGSAYLWMNDTQKAIQFYNRSLALDPKHFQTLMNLGIAKMSMGDRSGAAEAWEKVLAYYPDNPEAAMLRQAVEKLRSNKQGS